MDVVNDLAHFYTLLTNVDTYEQLKKTATENLKELYSQLVPICPHSQAVDHKYPKMGTFRVCKICGVEDQASYGGTPGDEYDYGYPGKPDPSFWNNATVEQAQDEKYFWTFRRQHGWTVKNGKATNVWSN